MTIRSPLSPMLLAAALALGGCAVVPADDYGYDDDRYYERETVIVTPPPRIEYRGLPPAIGYIWIDGYWNRVGPRPHWVPGYWSPPRVHSRPFVQPPRIDARPDGRSDRRDEHDRNRWRNDDGRRDDGRRDDRRWSDRSRDDDARRDRDPDTRPWPGFSPRRDVDRDGDGAPDRPQLRERRDLRDEARPPRILQERPPGAREGLPRTESPRERFERPAGGAGEAREPRRGEAGGRPPEGFRGFRRDDDGEARRGFRREARDGGNAPEARTREPAGN